MKPAPLSRILPVIARSGVYRLGPRQVTAISKPKADSHYALRELLNAVQELARGPFQGEGEAQQAASALAAELAQLGQDAARLLRYPADAPDRKMSSAWKPLDTEA
jgi:hypothetical protein